MRALLVVVEIDSNSVPSCSDEETGDIESESSNIASALQSERELHAISRDLIQKTSA